jgi:hypothetical protein
MLVFHQGAHDLSDFFSCSTPEDKEVVECWADFASKACVMLMRYAREYRDSEIMEEAIERWVQEAEDWTNVGGFLDSIGNRSWRRMLEKMSVYEGGTWFYPAFFEEPDLQEPSEILGLFEMSIRPGAYGSHVQDDGFSLDQGVTVYGASCFNTGREFLESLHGKYALLDLNPWPVNGRPQGGDGKAESIKLGRIRSLDQQHITEWQLEFTVIEDVVHGELGHFGYYEVPTNKAVEQEISEVLHLSGDWRELSRYWMSQYHYEAADGAWDYGLEGLGFSNLLYWNQKRMRKRAGEDWIGVGRFHLHVFSDFPHLRLPDHAEDIVSFY